MRHLGLLLTLLCASPVLSCPVCDSGTGKAVRAGIFGSDFGANLLVTLLPFGVFAVLVAAIYHGVPWQRMTGEAKRTGQDEGAGLPFR